MVGYVVCDNVVQDMVNIISFVKCMMGCLLVDIQVCYLYLFYWFKVSVNGLLMIDMLVGLFNLVCVLVDIFKVLVVWVSELFFGELDGVVIIVFVYFDDV